MAVFVVPSHVMHHRLRSGEVDPQDSRTAIMSQRQIRLAVPVEIGHPAAFRLDGVSDQMALPHHARLLGVLEPPQPVCHPAHRNDVRRSIVIDIHRPLAAIGHEFAGHLHRAVLMPLPFAALRSRDSHTSRRRSPGRDGRLHSCRWS